MQESQQKRSCGIDTGTQTDHTGTLPNDFFDEEYFTNNDDKFHYYTGLPNKDVLESVFELVVPFPGARRNTIGGHLS